MAGICRQGSRTGRLCRARDCRMPDQSGIVREETFAPILYTLAMTPWTRRSPSERRAAGPVIIDFHAQPARGGDVLRPVGRLRHRQRNIGPVRRGDVSASRRLSVKIDDDRPCRHVVLDGDASSRSHSQACRESARRFLANDSGLTGISTIAARHRRPPFGTLWRTDPPP